MPVNHHQRPHSASAIKGQPEAGDRMNHKLDLFGNAMDNLEGALRKFQAGDDGDQN